MPVSGCTRCGRCWSAGAAWADSPMAAQRLSLLRAELVAPGPGSSDLPGPLLAPVLGIGPQEGYQPVGSRGPASCSS